MDPITCNIRNAQGAAVAYISSDPATNVLSLSVTNTTSVDLRLTAGPPVAQPPPLEGDSFNGRFGNEK